MFKYSNHPEQISSDYPFQSKFAAVYGARMHYIEQGHGRAVVFLHGNPTWSYIWRNVIPFVSQYGRAIAVDNIGFGKSDSPDIEFTMETHAKYFEEFVKVLGLKDLVLVVHDYGAVPGLQYASQHESNVRGLAFMECAAAPVVPATYEVMPEEFVSLYRAWRDPVTGPQLLVEQNQFIEEVMPALTLNGFSEPIWDAYRQPFKEQARRGAILAWEQEVPINGEPDHSRKMIHSYNQWFVTTEIPKLFIYASPGTFMPPECLNWFVQNLKNLETAYVGAGAHYIQEEQPEAIGRAIGDWLRRLL